MKEVYGDLWTYPVPADKTKVICITTNGTIRRDGCAVMGRGCAQQAARRYPWLPADLGSRVHRNGNHVFRISDFFGGSLLTFPVKHQWHQKADLNLIHQSMIELMVAADAAQPETIFLLPRPGCGNGGLHWEDVKPLLEGLPDNIWVITRKETDK